MPDPSKSAQWNSGAYLVNGPGHCAECHSPRNFLGAIIESERFAGGPTPDGKDWVPNITPEDCSTAIINKTLVAKRHRELSVRRPDADGDSSAARWSKWCATPRNSARTTARRLPFTSTRCRPGEGLKPPPKNEQLTGMHTGKGIGLKLISALLFAAMSALVRYFGARYPVGEVVFFRSAFAIVPVC